MVGEWDTATETGNQLRPFYLSKSSSSVSSHLTLLHKVGGKRF